MQVKRVNNSDKVIYLNVRKSVAHIDEIRDLLFRRKPLVAILSETCTTSDIEDSEIECEGYDTYRIDSHTRMTGGCCIYVSKSLSSELVSRFSIEKAVWMVSVKVSNFDCIFTAVYNSPAASKKRCINIFNEWCDNDLDLTRKNIIAGDFNIDLMKHTTYPNQLRDIILCTGMKQYVKQFTRITERSRTMIDLVISNSDLNVEVLMDDVISDHGTIRINAEFFDKVNYKHKVFRQRLIGYSKEKLVQSLNQYDWNLGSKSVNDKADILVNRLSESVKSFVKTVEVKTFSSNAWYDDELMQLLRKKDLAYKEAVIVSNRRVWSTFKFWRNKYQRTIRDKKSNYIENKLDMAQGDPKQTWRILKEMLNGKQQNEIKTVNINGQNVTGTKEIAERMNVFFVESIKEINHNIPACVSSTKPTDASTTFEFKNVSWSTIEHHLSRMKNKSDVDFVKPKVILDSMEVIGPVLLQLVNESLNEGIVPEIFKLSTVCMVPKVTRANAAEEFRPINMLITLEKLLESIVKEQLIDYIETNELLSLYQSGYRKLHSCETSLNLVISKWKELRDKNYSIICVFLDLKRAFETIDRNHLLQKLKSFGLRNKSFKWFESYLTGRTQRTKVNGIFSEAIPNDLGVPQGSILGALAFILFINEMPRVVKSSFINLFADDTLLYVYGNNTNNMVTKLNEDLSRVYDWLSANKLKLNVDKTKFMHISKTCSEALSEVVINGEKIGMVRSIKYLGVIIDDQLKFDENAKHVSKKVASKIYLFGRISKNLTFGARHKVYQSIILPHFQYCTSLLFAANSTCIDKLQKLQNRALRIVLRCKQSTSVKSMLDTLSSLSVNQEIIFGTLKMAFKIKNGMVPKYLTGACKKNKETHGYNLRNNEDFRLPLYRKSNAQRMLMYNGLKEFNKLPSVIKNASKFPEFVSRVKDFVRLSF